MSGSARTYCLRPIKYLAGDGDDVLAKRQPVRFGGTVIATYRFGVETGPGSRFRFGH